MIRAFTILALMLRTLISFKVDAGADIGRSARDPSSTLPAAHETSTGVSRAARRLRAAEPGHGPPLFPCRRQARAT